MAEPFRAAFDGGSRGNPGPAAWGVAVLGADGEVVEGHAASIGAATNNVAEYHGLLEALRLAVDGGFEEVELRSDSELIVKQLKGVYRVKQPHLKVLFREALKMIRRFARFDIVHVPRAENGEADRLVNVALDAGDGSRIVERA